MKNSILLFAVAFFSSAILPAKNELHSNRVNSFHILSSQLPTTVQGWEMKKGTFEKQSNAEIEKITKALNAANMDQFRLRSKRRAVQFSNGIVVELFSAEEMKQKGANIDPAFYSESLPANYQEPTYDVTEGGHLIQIHKTIENGKHNK